MREISLIVFIAGKKDEPYMICQACGETYRRSEVFFGELWDRVAVVTGTPWQYQEPLGEKSCRVCSADLSARVVSPGVGSFAANSKDFVEYDQKAREVIRRKLGKD